ncbi:hypothetical protein [Pleomorphomonas oryzae]|uniref:hypothetical protein n=1 Tax=Pleomorphomonas oryzae TaxID=261934 RepID=UPI0004251C38|nr:hypothetical protein [Pleomorphomonas oryzae]
MTISSETNRSGPYSCNGATTIFPFQFKVYAASHVKAILFSSDGSQSVLALNTDYTVTGVGSDTGGSIVTSVAYPAGKTLTILLNVPFTQDIDLENQGAYYAETIERGLDLMAQRVLQLAEKIKRAFTAPANIADGAEIDPTLLEQIAGNAGAIANYKDEAQAAATSATISAANAQTSATAAAASAATAQTFSGVARRIISFTAAAGQTVFPLGETLANPAACDVYHEGVKFPQGSDNYTLTSTTLTLANAASVGEKVEVFVISSFAVAGALVPANNLSDVSNQAAARTNLGLGSAAVKNTGVAAGNVIALDGSAKLPAVDGSQLTGLVRSVGSVPLAGAAFKDITGIPAGARRITIDLTAVSRATGTADSLQVQLGTTAGVVTTGYAGTLFGVNAAVGYGTTALSAGALVGCGGGGASNACYALYELFNLSGNLWKVVAHFADGTRAGFTVGYVSLPGVLDRIRVGTDTGANMTGGNAYVYWE